MAIRGWDEAGEHGNQLQYSPTGESRGQRSQAAVHGASQKSGSPEGTEVHA